MLISQRNIILNKSYRIAAIYPSIFVIITCFILAIVDNYDYKSEWLTGGAFTLLVMLIAFVYSFVMCLLSLTIMLNKKEKIRTNSVLNILSWFLLPLIAVGITIIHDISYRLKYNEHFGIEFVFILLLTIPYIIGLIWSFIYYNRNKTAC